jgi:hypothetical protein
MVAREQEMAGRAPAAIFALLRAEAVAEAISPHALGMVFLPPPPVSVHTYDDRVFVLFGEEFDVGTALSCSADKMEKSAPSFQVQP